MIDRFETLNWLPGPYFSDKFEINSTQEAARLHVMKNRYSLQPSFHHLLAPEEQKPESFLRYPLVSVATKGQELVFDQDQERIEFWDEFLKTYWRRPTKMIIINHFPHWTGGGQDMVPHLAALAYNLSFGAPGPIQEPDVRELAFHWFGTEDIRCIRGFRDVRANHCMAWGPLFPASLPEDYRNAGRFLNSCRNYNRLLFTCLSALDEVFDRVQIAPTKVDYLLNFRPQAPASYREFMDQAKKAAFADRKKVGL